MTDPKMLESARAYAKRNAHLRGHFVESNLAEFASEQVRERTPTAAQLSKAFKRYAELFGQYPHGTEQQMAALLELVPAFNVTEREG